MGCLNASFKRNLRRGTYRYPYQKSFSIAIFASLRQSWIVYLSSDHWRMWLLMSSKSERFVVCRIPFCFGLRWHLFFKQWKNQRCSWSGKSCSAEQSGLKQAQFEKDCLQIFRETQINIFSQSSFEEIFITVNISRVLHKIVPEELNTVEKGCQNNCYWYITFH